jgi:DNA-binding MarR family transcriptional regulator
LTVGVLGQPHQRAVADSLDVSRASITQRVTALRECGLVRVTRDATDARSQRVSLTDDGESLLETAWRGLDEHDNGLDHGVDIQALERELDTLIRNARRYLGLGDGLPAEQGARGPRPLRAAVGVRLFTMTPVTAVLAACALLIAASGHG